MRLGKLSLLLQTKSSESLHVQFQQGLQQPEASVTIIQ